MARRKSSTPLPRPEANSRPARALGGLWRLFFAVDHMRPRSWAERRHLRFRAFFFLLLGFALGVAFRSALAGIGLVAK